VAEQVGRSWRCGRARRAPSAHLPARRDEDRRIRRPPGVDHQTHQMNRRVADRRSHRRDHLVADRSHPDQEDAAADLPARAPR